VLHFNSLPPIVAATTDHRYALDGLALIVLVYPKRSILWICRWRGCRTNQLQYPQGLRYEAVRWIVAVLSESPIALTFRPTRSCEEGGLLSSTRRGRRCQQLVPGAAPRPRKGNAV